MGDAKTLAVEIRDVPEQPYLGKRFSASLETVGEEVRKAYGELYGALASAGVAPTAPPFLIADMPKDGRIEVEAGAPCASPPAVGGLTAGSLPAGRVAVVVHHGRYDTIGQVYEALHGWIAANGHTIAGPPREVYLSEPEVPLDQHVTEVVWPIA